LKCALAAGGEFARCEAAIADNAMDRVDFAPEGTPLGTAKRLGRSPSELRAG